MHKSWKSYEKNKDMSPLRTLQGRQQHQCSILKSWYHSQGGQSDAGLDVPLFFCGLRGPKREQQSEMWHISICITERITLVALWFAHLNQLDGLSTCCHHVNRCNQSLSCFSNSQIICQELLFDESQSNRSSNGRDGVQDPLSER